MQSLDLNLATRPFRNNTLLWTGFVLGLVALVAVTTWNVQSYRTSTQGLADLRERAGDIESRRADLERRYRETLQAIDRHDLGLLAVRSGKANEVIRWKSFSWTRLFNLLQDVQPYGVQMASIHPVFRAGDTGRDPFSVEASNVVPVSVEGIARGLEDFFEFERSLLGDPHFDRVEPMRTNTDPNSGETVFQLQFLYDPTVRAEVPEDLVAEEDGGEEGTAEPDTGEDAPEGEAIAAVEEGAGEDVPDGGGPAPVEDAEAVDAELLDALGAVAAMDEEALNAGEGGREPAPAGEEAPVASGAEKKPPAEPEEAAPQPKKKKRNPRRRNRKTAKDQAAPPPTEPGAAEQPSAEEAGTEPPDSDGETDDSPGGAGGSLETGP